VGRRKIWHESQKITKVPDGSLEITFRVVGLDEIKSWVLSFGPEAEVLEPVKLRKIIRNDLYGMLEQYQARRIGINLMKEIQAV
jgi:predicted DNA-binding transcriptional regulator YafY